MRCDLMHKNILVAVLNIDEHTGVIQKIVSLENEKHLPVGVKVKNNIVDRAALNDWWIDRSIPASRSGIRKALEVLDLHTTKALLVKCFGLSLSDQYWIRPENTDIKWSDINFFENAFSEDIGNVLLGKEEQSRQFDFHSPDNTSDGCLKKRWKIIDGKRCLIKGGSAPFMQQPFNEVIASKIMDRLGIKHVPYTLIWDDGKPYSVCEDFVSADTELVSAWRVMQTQKKDNSTSVYKHYLNCCETLGIKNIRQSVDEMIVLDYMIANEDRHQNNFGLLRKAETLEWIGVAPIFDSGSSLGYDKMAGQITANRDVECKPFKKTHGEQLKLATSFEWIDFSKLEGIDDEIRTILNAAEEYADQNRIEAIVSSVMRRLETLQQMALQPIQTEDHVQRDVEEDISEDYGFEMKL